MTSEELKKLIAGDEGETVEVKEATGQYLDACETLCAFLNYDPPICDSNPCNEYEQGGKARAEYGDGLLKRLAKRLSESDFSVSSLKDYRSFYLIYPELSQEIAGYLLARFAQGQSLPKLFSIDVYALEAKSHTVCGLLPEKDNQCVAFSHNEGLLRENGRIPFLTKAVTGKCRGWQTAM